MITPDSMPPEFGYPLAALLWVVLIVVSFAGKTNK